MTTSSHRTARHSPLELSSNRTASHDCMARAQSSRFSEVFDSVQLAETSTLAPSKSVPRVRIHFPPPHSPEVQRNPPGLLLKLREMGAIPHLLRSNRTGERVLLIAAGKLCSLFLRRAYEQSGFNNSVRRMQCDHKPISSHL